MKAELTTEQLVEIGKALTGLDQDKKDLIFNQVIHLNNTVRDYENRIRNAINQLSV